jgi:O-antigen/teichoic acid export membrane protein
MKLDFVKNTKRNIIARLSFNGVDTAVCFFRKTIFMWILGSEYLGLNGLFYSILGVLSMAELGFGHAVVSHMYKLIATDNKKLFCAYLRFYQRVYRYVGTFIFVGGLCLLPFLRYLIHGNVPPEINLKIVYILFLANSAIGFLFFAYRGSILGAYHNDYILSYIDVFSAIVEFLVLCLVLFLTHNYYYYLIIVIARTIFQNIIIFVATRIYYPDVIPQGTLPPEEKKRVIKDVSAIVMHKFGGIINSYADNLIISAFIGLTAIGAYGNYTHITGAVAGVIVSLCYSMTGGFGNKIYTESRDENFELLMKAHRMLMCLIIWCAAMLIALFQPFMVLWIRNRPELLRHFVTPILMVILFYETKSRESLQMFKQAAAIWQKDKWKPIIATIFNLTMNIILVMTLPDEYKLDGVILATIVSDVFIQVPWESYAVFTSFFSVKEAKCYWRRQSMYTLLAVIVCSATWGVTCLIPIAGFWGLFWKGAAAVVVATVLLIVFLRDDALLVFEGLKRHMGK